MCVEPRVEDEGGSNPCAEIFLLLFLENVQFGQAEKIEQSLPSNKSLDCW